MFSHQQVLRKVTAIRREATAGRMRERRKSAGAGVSELASVVGVTTATMSRWERGITRPTAEHAERWESVLVAIEGGDVEGLS